MHLAQLNIGKLKGGKDDPAMAGFFDNLDRISAVAERMPGFVWRLKDDSGNATSIPWVGDASIVANLTVWESVETLEKFVWQTVHTRIYHRKGEFFEKMQTPHFVMWWIAAGQTDTLRALGRGGPLVVLGVWVFVALPPPPSDLKCCQITNGNSKDSINTKYMSPENRGSITLPAVVHHRQ